MRFDKLPANEMSPEESDQALDRVFTLYRAATPEFEASPRFLAGIWERIEATRPVAWLAPLRLWGTRLAAAAAVVTILLAGYVKYTVATGSDIDVLNTTYADVLTADSLDEHDQALWVLAENSR